MDTLLLWFALAGSGYVLGRQQRRSPDYKSMAKSLVQTGEELKLANHALRLCRVELTKSQLVRDESDRSRRKLEWTIVDLRPGHAPYCSYGTIHAGNPLGCSCGAFSVPEQPLDSEAPR